MLSIATKKALLSISNALYGLTDEQGDLTTKGMAIAAPFVVAALLIAFYVMGSDV